MKVSVVKSAGGSFCWNYATDTFYGNYASDNVCCIFASFEAVLSVTIMLVDLSVAIVHVTVSVAILQHICKTFIAILQIGVSVAIMQVLFSAVNYAHDCFHCNYAGESWAFKASVWRWGEGEGIKLLPFLF